jgi:Xaa-Pro aminopeptidase
VVGPVEYLMRSEIIARQRRAMADGGLDAIISCSPENFAYVTGFVVPSQPLLRHRHAMAVVTADGNAALLGVDMEQTTIRSKAPDACFSVWAEFSDDAMQVLSALLKQLGLGQARIGIELSYLPASDFMRLQTLLPDAQFVSCDQILARLRQLKTTQEVDLLRKLSQIADQAITKAIAAVSPGDTEMDIAAHLTRNVYELGAQQFKLMIVATGERSELPNVGPSFRKLARGDVCRIEIFSVIDGYHAGVCRTAVVQQAPPHAKEIWQVLTDCKHELLERIKPGASCRAIYNAFIDRLARSKLPPISFVGHGIGLFLHEDPYLGHTPIIGSTEDAALEAGMVLGFEPLCYRTGYGFGMQNKDMVAVTDRGCELLSDYAETDQLLKIG